MIYDEYIAVGLSDEYPVKIILKGFVEINENEKIGITEVVYVTTNTELAQKRIETLLEENQDESYYMVYSVPFDTDLTTLNHYPSIAIKKEDLI